MNNHVEIVAASIYYGRRTPGLVLLRNGHAALHLTGRDARRKLAEIAGRLRALPQPKGAKP